MPTYKITDPSTGKVMRITGDYPPTEAELNEVFSAVQGAGESDVIRRSPGKSAAVQNGGTTGAEISANSAAGGTAGRTVPEWYKPVRKAADAVIAGVNAVPVPSVPTMAKNAPRNAAQIVSGLAQTARHPIVSLNALKDYIGGAGESARGLTGRTPYAGVPEEQRVREEAAFAPTKNALAEMFRNPAGIPRRVVDYLNEKPLDAAMWASGGMAAAGKAAQAAGATRAGVYAGARVPASLARFIPTTETLGRAAEATNPVTGAAKAVSRFAPTIEEGAARLAGETLGTTTGAGKGAVEGALGGGQAFADALRGKISGEEIVRHAKGALQTIVNKRGAEYRAKLDEISTDPVAYFGIKDGLDQELTRLVSPDEGFNIKVRQGPRGQLAFDLSKSTIVEKEGLVQKALTDVISWKDTTPKGLDVLKKRLRDYIDQAGQDRTPAKTLLTRLEKSLDSGLKRDIPGYTEMTKGYAEATSLINDLESALMFREKSLTGHIVADQTLRRLTSALKENFELRGDLLDALDVQGGTGVASEVAGYSLNHLAPRGLVGKGIAGGSVGWAAAHLHPYMLPIIAASSPRVVGEFLLAYGKAQRATAPLRRTAGQAATAATRPLPASAGYALGQARQEEAR